VTPCHGGRGHGRIIFECLFPGTGLGHPASRRRQKNTCSVDAVPLRRPPPEGKNCPWPPMT
jgi:hypothetical protein